MASIATKERKSTKLSEPLAQPTARIPRLNAFRVGTWNGIAFSADDLNSVVSAFDTLSTGPTPEIQPVAVLGHSEDQPFMVAEGLNNVGLVSDCYAEGDRLYLDVDDAPANFAAACNAKRYSAVSVEFKQDYTDSQGRTWPWVLSRVAFLGAELPAVKGLEPVPQAVFAASTDKTKVFTFSEAPAVDRTQILQALTAAGQDVTAVTDAVPDGVLASWLAACQKASMASAPAPVIPPNPAPNAPAQPTTVPQYAAPNGPPCPGTPNPVVPPKMADDSGDTEMKPAEMAAKFAEMNKQIADLNSKLVSVAKFAETTQHDRKRERANAAVTAAVTAFKLPPASRDATFNRLMRADSVVCFAEGPSKGKSEFDLQIDELAALPVVRKFGEQMADPITQEKGSPMTADRRAQLLKATHEGRAILKTANAAK